MRICSPHSICVSMPCQHETKEKLMSEIDVTKEYRTRDGRQVIDLRRLSIALENGDVISGCVKARDGDWFLDSWSSDGRYNNEEISSVDLVEVPRKIVTWVNMYKTNCSPHRNRERAQISTQGQIELPACGLSSKKVRGCSHEQRQ